MKHIQALLLYLLVACLAWSCSESDSEPPFVTDPVEEGMADCTILVYMVANNNLGSSRYDGADIEEMQLAARLGHVNSGSRLVVYHQPYRAMPVLKEVKADGSIDTLRTYGTDTTSVSVARMQAVIDDAKLYRPARRYGLVLWSHASGWLQDGIEPESTRSLAPALYSYGLDDGKRMSITSLQTALEGKGLDFIYFDCCYMGSVETLYQLRSAANVMIAAPTEVPAKGMPYHSTLNHLFKEDYIGAAKATYEYYDSVYTLGSCPVSMTVVRTEGLASLAAATREVYSQAAEAWPEGYSPQPFCLRPYYYYDLEDYVKTLCPDSALFAHWQQARDNAVIYKAAQPSIWGELPLNRYGGLSTYIFASEDDRYLNSKNYRELDWWTDVSTALPLN